MLGFECSFDWVLHINLLKKPRLQKGSACIFQTNEYFIICFKMYGASSNFNPYPKMGGHAHGSHGNMGGHAHGGHGHSHAPGEQCGMHRGVDEDTTNFPSPGPQDKAKPPAPPAPSRPEPASMNIVQAVQYGEMEKLKEFIENGTDVRTPDAENVTLLHWAAINNRVEIVKYELYLYYCIK